MRKRDKQSNLSATDRVKNLIGEEKKSDGGISKTKLLLGAAGLLLFIVGVKRSYQLDDERTIVLSDDGVDGNGTEAGAKQEGAGMNRR